MRGEERCLYTIDLSRGPGLIGTEYGDVVFHLFYGTRARRSRNEVLGTIAAQAESAWYEATQEYLSEGSATNRFDTPS